MSGGFPARRRKRWGPRVLDAVFALVIGLVAGGAFDLNRPWIKSRVLAWVHSSIGLEADYASARLLSLHGVEVDDLVIRGRVPAESLHAHHASARWSFFGRGPTLERVDVTDVTLTVVIDEQPPSLPLSHRAGQVLASPPPMTELHASRVNIATVWTNGGRVMETDAIRGLEIAAVAEPSANGWRVRGRADAPRAVDLTRDREGSIERARATFALVADMSTSALTIASNADVLGTGEVHVDATARFEPANHRIAIAVDDVRVAGAATAKASIRLPDEGDALLEHAEGDLDGARVLEWLPAALVPITAESAKIRYSIDGAVLASSPYLVPGGQARIEAQLANAKLRTSDIVFDAGAAKVAFEARASSLSAIAELDGVKAELEGVKLAASDLSVDLDGEQAPNGLLEARLALRFSRLDGSSPEATVVARDGHGRVRIAGSNAALSANVAAVEARHAGIRVLATSFGLESRNRRDFDISAASTELFVNDRAFRSPARVALQVEANNAWRASIDVDQGRASIRALKHRDAIDYALEATTQRLPVALEIHSKGRLERIGSADPILQQETSIDIEQPVFRGMSARSLAVSFEAKGTLSHQEVVAKVQAPGLSIGGSTPIDDTLGLTATIDRHPWSVHFDAGLAGHLQGRLSGFASFDDNARAIRFDLDGLASGLAALGPVAGFDLSRTELGFTTRGSLSGVVESMDDRGNIELARKPGRTASLDGTVDLRLAKLRWTEKDTEIDVPIFVWHGEMREEGNRRRLHGRAEIDSVRILLGRHQVDLAGISDDASASVAGDLRNPVVEVSQRGTIRAVEQDYVVEYPLGDITTSLSAERNRDGLLRVSNLSLHNARGGTTLDVSGSIDAEGRRKRLAVAASLDQDLAPLSAFADRFSGRGHVKVAASLESPNLSLFRTHGSVKIEQARVNLPFAHVVAEGIDGDIPIREVFDVDHGVITINRKVAPSPFARLGLDDRHPLLQRGGFISIARLDAPHIGIAPLVGNLSVDQNAIALEHFEMGLRGGWLTGDCMLDWEGLESKLETHLRASGVRSSRGEPFDGNIALVLGARDRMIEGRAEVTRIGGQHLLDLLDVADPLRTDASMNAVRSALTWGHPKRASATFANGFANAQIELGGLAKLLTVPDLRGVPTGPLVDRLVETVLDGKETP